jgi:Type II secretion system (T2SS), protein E, N-terminal domain
MSRRLAQYLSEKNFLKASVVAEGLRLQGSKLGTLDTVLLEMGACGEALLLQALSELSRIRSVNLSEFEPDGTAKDLMPLKMAQKLGCVPLSLDDNTLHVASVFPVAAVALKEVGYLIGRKIELWVALECRVREWQSFIYSIPLEPRFLSLLLKIDPTRSVAPIQSTVTVKKPMDAQAFSALEKQQPLDDDELHVGLGDEDAPPRTRVIDAVAYSEFAKGAETRPSAPSKTGPGQVSTLGQSGPLKPTPLASPGFPGGVMPPKSAPRAPTPPPAPPPDAPYAPSAAPRPPMVAAVAPLFPRRTLAEIDLDFDLHETEATKPATPASAPRRSSEELDFSDLNEEVIPPAISRPRVPAEPLTISPNRPVPVPQYRPPIDGSDALAPAILPAAAPSVALGRARQRLNSGQLDRDALLTTIVDFGRAAFPIVAAFGITKGTARGWVSHGTLSPIRSISVAIDTPSLFRTVVLSQANYLGPALQDPGSTAILSRLVPLPASLFLWPIVVQSRVVSLIFAAKPPGPFVEPTTAEFALLCQDASAALETLLVTQKQHRAPAHDSAAVTMPQNSTSDIDALVTELNQAPDARVQAIFAELSADPEPAAVALVRALTSTVKVAQLPVEQLPELAAMGPTVEALTQLGAPAARALVPALYSEDQRTRYFALLTAGYLPFPFQIEGVFASLLDADPQLSSAARAAAGALKQFPEWAKPKEALRQTLVSGDALQRGLAARALGTLSDRESISLLIDALSDDDMLCADSALAALTEMTRTSHGLDTSAWTAWLSHAQGKRRLEWLIDALSDERLEFRAAAIEELAAQFGSDGGYHPEGSESDRLAAVASWESFARTHPEIDV